MAIKRFIGNTWYIEAQQTVPLYMVDKSHCILLDSGAQYSRTELETALDEAGIRPIGLLCTHSHFDHFGNAKYFSRKFGCPIALPLGEAEICRTPASVKSHLYVYTAGQVESMPILADSACLVDHIIRPEETDTMFRGVLFRVLHTPGHSPDHVAYVTPDNVCYTGDGLMAGKALVDAKLPYSFNIRQNLKSMERFRGSNFDGMLVAHGGVWQDDPDRLVEENIRVVTAQLERVRALVDRPMSAEQICRRVCRELDIRVSTPVKAQNLERFLRPYMECMLDDGTHVLTVKNDTLCYAPAHRG